MSAGQSAFLDVEATCKVLQRVSLQFAEDSEEREAISAAACALLTVVTINARREFEAFLASREPLQHASEEMLAEWLANHPDAEPGTTVVIGGRSHVVTLGYDSRLHLAPIRDP
jgi:hypothetical protein